MPGLVDFSGHRLIFCPGKFEILGILCYTERCDLPATGNAAKTEGFLAFAGVMKRRDFVREKEECL